eukprot:CAMPEP_0172556496 /NCGR_PEP_ID=MMETSP1067-20121228/66665_1 /TAXON_ID=265564 ORGANISM="Thalassiosira punctigera, Strain Tpunct2005C2" /NCGR_SAMPLE_ID=MMETSP1067 /ASSEMBLY_ACC=CAM_ASM_000444 /LENGTH=67 /DNA_ID=CAMNT_0013345323 /DNA_START=451 /DNA_END=650 /DNA_ORIENTATION=+
MLAVDELEEPGSAEEGGHVAPDLGEVRPVHGEDAVGHLRAVDHHVRVRPVEQFRLLRYGEAEVADDP